MGRTSKSRYLKKYGKKQQNIKTNQLRELKNFPCEDCKKKYPHYIMQFDHVPERGPKKILINMLWIGTWEKIINELFKCDLVCANCHAIRTYRRKQEKYGF